MTFYRDDLFREISVFYICIEIFTICSKNATVFSGIS